MAASDNPSYVNYHFPYSAIAYELYQPQSLPRIQQADDLVRAAFESKDCLRLKPAAGNEVHKVFLKLLFTLYSESIILTLN